MSRRTSISVMVIVTVLSVTLIWAGCWRRTDNTGRMRVGVVLPLTGGAASLGKATLNGIQLATENYNSTKNGEQPLIELQVEDDRADPATSVSAFQKLVDANDVQMILGPLTSGGTLAVAPIATRNHVVVLSPGASAPAVSQAGDYIFRNELSEEYGAREQARLAYSRLNYRSISLLYVNNEYGAGTIRVFKDEFSKLGGRITIEEAFNAGATDFRTALTKIRQANPDAMFVVFQDEIVNILKQRAELGLTTPVYTTPVFEDRENLQKLGSLADGVIYTYYGAFNPNAKAGETSKFITAYQSRFGGPPTYYAALGYDAASILVSALIKSDFRPDNLKEALYSIQNFPGVTGLSSFDRNGDVTKPVSLKSVKGGDFIDY